MPCLQRLPAVTARSILRFIQSIQTDTGRKWTGKECFTCYSEEIKKMITSHEKIIKQDTSNTLELETDWEHLNTRMFHAEIGIYHKFQLMQAILSKEDSKDKRLEVERLKIGILDTNSGALSNMSVIHQVLVGHTITNPNDKGLLEKWSKGIYNNMRTHPMSAKMYQDYVDTYLEKAAILQFRGILLYMEVNKNSRYDSHHYKLFENNLKSQIDTMEKSVPTYLKYLTDPEENEVFVLRPVFDGRDEPFVRSQGPNKALRYDYMCGFHDRGKWIFQKSSQFNEDGSLLIAGKSIGSKRNYISVSEKNKAICVSEECHATPFFVIPLDFIDNKMTIIICKSNSKPKDKRFLGNSLKFIDGQDNREFTLSFDCV